VKPFKSYDKQIEILRSRGCVVESDEECRQQLARINYYRLSAYFLPYKNHDESYVRKVSFRRVIDTYEFDRRLQNILMLAIEEAEINLRSKLAYYHANQYGPLGYMDPETHAPGYNHAAFLKLFWGQVSSNDTSLVAKHHMREYGGNFPIWVAVEFFSFGMLSRFYSDLKPSDRRRLAHDVYICGDPDGIKSWLRCCTDLRNICAHYGRLYYRIFSAIPRGITVSGREGDKYAQRRLFSSIMALRKLYPDPVKWDSEVVEAISALIERYENSIELWHIGFPEDWKSELTLSHRPI